MTYMIFQASISRCDILASAFYTLIFSIQRVFPPPQSSLSLHQDVSIQDVPMKYRRSSIKQATLFAWQCLWTRFPSCPTGPPAKCLPLQLSLPLESCAKSSLSSLQGFLFISNPSLSMYVYTVDTQPVIIVHVCFDELTKEPFVWIMALLSVLHGTNWYYLFHKHLINISEVNYCTDPGNYNFWIALYSITVFY